MKIPMKKILFLIAIMSISTFCKGQEDQLGPVVSMEYKIRSSWEMYPILHFLLKQDENGYRLTNATGCDENEAPSMAVPDTFAEQIKQIVLEEKMLSYKRDYEPPFQVLDGESWNIYIRFAGSKKSVYSSGYMAHPDGDGLKRIEQLCEQQWKSKK